MSQASRSRYLQRNQGVERMGHILEILSLSAQPLSLQALSRQLGSHPSSTHRVLKTMEEQGLIGRLGSTELYQLGPKILTLATRMLNRYPVRDVAAPYLYHLTFELGFTAALSHYSDGYVTYLDCKEGPNPTTIVLRPGGVVPAHCAASGRVQLAFLDPSEVDRLTQRGLQPCGPGEPKDVKSLTRMLAVIRERGYELEGGYFPGISTVAVPILDDESHPIAAIAVAAFAGQIPAEDVPRIASAIKDAARAIAAKLGHARGEG
jgi:IclR family acetate operon transcriptional repressor